MQHLGLGRTLLDLAGLEEVPFPGESLLPLVSEPKSPPFFALASAGETASTTNGAWHLILCLERHKLGSHGEVTWMERHSVQLFDLDADPGCTEDVSRDHPEAVKRNRAGLIRWLNAAEDLGWAEATEVGEGTLAQLRDLGYTGAATGGAESRLIDPECDCDRCLEFR